MISSCLSQCIVLTNFQMLLEKYICFHKCLRNDVLWSLAKQVEFKVIHNVTLTVYQVGKRAPLFDQE